MKRFLNIFKRHSNIFITTVIFVIISITPVYAVQTDWYNDSLIFWEATEYDIVNLGYKPVNVMFHVQLDNEYKSLIQHVIRVDGDTMYSGFTTVEGAKLPRVKGPFKPGYTFIGWRDLEDKEGKVWNHETDIITKNTSFVAVFKKGSTYYKVKFNSNGGTPVEDITIESNDSLKKPKDPVKEGYKFTEWYKDSACTQPWDYANDVVDSDITLYAGWIELQVTAMPTTSKVLVNGMSIEFEAYNIKGYNYFKLRDLAQAVNNTSKNFEVTWDGTKNAINLLSNTHYTPVGGELAKGDGKPKTATLTTSTIYKDGKEIYPIAYNINGNNYFKLRDMAEAFGIDIAWDGATNTISINTGDSYGGNIIAKDSKEDTISNETNMEEGSNIIEEGSNIGLAEGSNTKAPEVGKIEEPGTEEPAVEDDFEKNIIMPYLVHKNTGVRIDLTDTKNSIYQKLGQPKEIYSSGNNEIWMYDDEHGDFTVICLYNDNVEMINTISELWEYCSVLSAGDSVKNIDLVRNAGGYSSMESELIPRYDIDKSISYVYSSEVRALYGLKARLSIYVDTYLETVIGFTIEKPHQYLNFTYESFTDKELGKIVFYYTNAYRSRLGIEPLAWSEKAYQAAHNHAKDMFERDFFSHDSPTEYFGERITRELGRVYASEVIYQEKNNFNPIHPLVGWLKSPFGHREATLRDRFIYAGTSFMGTREDARCVQIYFKPLD